MLIFSMRRFQIFFHRFSSTSILSSSPPIFLFTPFHPTASSSSPPRLLHRVFFLFTLSSSLSEHLYLLTFLGSPTPKGFFSLDRVEEKDLHYNLLYDTSQELRRRGNSDGALRWIFFNAEFSTVLAISLPPRALL